MVMKRGVLLLIGLLTVCLALVGCTENGSSDTGEGYYKYTGSKAVEASFVEGSPYTSQANRYEEGENIDIEVELENRLTDDIPSGRIKVRLTGEAAISNLFSGAKTVTLSKQLDGIDEETGGGDTEIVELGPIKYVGDVTSLVKKTISGQYCYEVPIKVKANIYLTDKADDIGTTLPSGANPPSRVKVTNLRQEVVKVEGGKGTLDFSITVNNGGSGTIVDSLSDCFEYRKRPDEYVRVSVDGPYTITCEDKELRLKRDTKEGILDCEIKNIDASNLGPDPIEVTITLDGFAYEENLQPVTLWLEPKD